MGIRAVDAIIDRTWVGLSAFSDWLYCPREAGYFDTEARAAYYSRVVEPVCARAYWDMSLSFRENLAIRHDKLLPAQPYQELLVCLPRIEPQHLSLEALAVPGSDPMVRAVHSLLFQEAEARLKRANDGIGELDSIEHRISAAAH